MSTRSCITQRNCYIQKEHTNQAEVQPQETHMMAPASSIPMENRNDNEHIQYMYKTISLFITSHVLCKHSNGERASLANL